MYTTLSPCWGCFPVLVNAGLKKFIYMELYHGEPLEDRIQKVVEAAGIQIYQLGVNPDGPLYKMMAATGQVPDEAVLEKPE